MIRQKSYLNFDPVMETIKVNRENIAQFKAIESIRSIRKTQVSKLMTAFKEGSYLESTPLHINVKKKEFRVIDGNHRIVALRELLENDRFKGAKLTVAFYKNLNDQEERNLYDIIAKQVGQTTNDFLSLHRPEFPIWKLIQKKSFPVKITIYGSKDSLQFKALLYLIHAMQRKRFEQGVMYLNRETMLKVGSRTDLDTYKTLSRFSRIFLASYGAPGTANKYSSMQIILPLFHIWYHNQENHSKQLKTGNYTLDVMWVKRFEQIMSDPEMVLYLHSHLNRELMPKVRSRMIELMQPYRGKKTTKFKLK